jgi:hypothetical protein
MPSEAYTNGTTKPQAHFRVLDWRAIGKGSVVGVCTVEMSLMRILGVMIMRGSDGALWAALPSKPREVDGKRIYDKVLEWRSPEIANRWSAQVIAGLRGDPRIDLGDSPAPRGDSVTPRQGHIAGLTD